MELLAEYSSSAQEALSKTFNLGARLHRAQQDQCRSFQTPPSLNFISPVNEFPGIGTLEATEPELGGSHTKIN